MREVIGRPFEEYRRAEAPEGFGRLPDLILLDGGKEWHVAAVRLPLLRQMGIDVPVYGMVKDDKHRTRAIAEDGGEITRSNRAAFTLISTIQDEVHRFAIGYHRQQRKKYDFHDADRHPGHRRDARPGADEAFPHRARRQRGNGRDA